MPLSALNRVAVDHCLPVRDIAGLLIRLASSGGSVLAPPKHASDVPNKDLEIEVQIAKENRGQISEIMDLGTPSMFTCPECHGTLLRLNDEQVFRFRCHTGHAFTASSLLETLTERTEEALWNSVRAIEESAMLLAHTADHVSAEADRGLAEEFRRSSEEALRRAQAVRALIPGNRAAVEERAKKVS